MSFCFRTFVHKHRTSRGHLSASIRLVTGILFEYSASVVCPQGICVRPPRCALHPHPPFFIILIILNILQYIYVHITIPSIGLHTQYCTSPTTPNLATNWNPLPPNFFLHFLNNFNSSYTYTSTPLTGTPPPTGPPPPHLSL